MSQDSAPADLQLPASVSQSLALRNIAYRAVGSGNSAARKLRMSVLHDAQGSLLIVHGEDHLLDLGLVAAASQRTLRPLPGKALEALLAQHQLPSLPGVPQVFDMPCLFDAELTRFPLFRLDSGQPGLLLELNQLNLLRLLSGCKPAKLSVPLAQIKPNLHHPEQDRQQITRAVEQFTPRRIRQRLEETLELPPLPQNVQKILQLRNDPKAIVDDITAIIETDPALAAQVISWASSPYYGSPSKIRSVEDAISRVLGFDQVLNLALGVSLNKSVPIPANGPENEPPYWQKALYCAMLIEGLNKALPPARRPENGLCYLAGLLHNFGYLLLAHIFPTYFDTVCRHIEANPHVQHHYIEQHLLGITGEQMTAWLMQCWNMPEELITAIRFQHEPDYEGPHAEHANLLYLASALQERYKPGRGRQKAIPARLLKRLGLEQEQLIQVMRKVQAAEDALREFSRLLKSA